jgi:hypothetical protein
VNFIIFTEAEGEEDEYISPSNSPTEAALLALKSPLISHPLRNIASQSILSLNACSISSPVLNILPANIKQMLEKYHFKFFAKALFNEQKQGLDF